MTKSAFAGPLIGFGQGDPQNYNPDRAPSIFDQGALLMDPRFPYVPGRAPTKSVIGYPMFNDILQVTAVPSTIATANIAALQVPVAGTAITLVPANGAGITINNTITRSDTKAIVTGLRAIDLTVSMLAFGQGGAGLGGPVSSPDPATTIARNVRITSVGNDTPATFVVRGYDQYFFPVTETITGSNASVASGKKAFKYIQSITPAGTPSGSNISVGTGDLYGFGMRQDFFDLSTIYWNSATIVAATGFTAAVITAPTATTGDVRGTYGVQSASDGTKRLTIFTTPLISNIQTAAGIFGPTQFADF